MITDSFDSKTAPIISPGAFYGEQKHLCDICIVIFSKVIFDHVLERFPCEKVAEIHACNGRRPVYILTHGDRRIAFYLSSVGSTAAATDVIEVNWFTGATRFIMFGSAGSLDQQATTGKYVIPTEAYRDEGMSYHYAEPSDYIAIPEADTVAAMFDDMKVPYVKGRVWTTDALYRETRELTEKRRSEGCLAVEMELAGVQAVCDFHGFRLFNFLMTGDVLDEPEYRYADLNEANHDLDKFYLALEMAHRL